MYSFHGRSSLPYSFQRNSAPDDASAQALDGKAAEKLVDNAKSNGQENEVDDRPIRLPNGGKHKKHKIPNKVRYYYFKLQFGILNELYSLQVPNDQDDAVIPMPYEGAKGFGENGRPIVIPVSEKYSFLNTTHLNL